MTKLQRNTDDKFMLKLDLQTFSEPEPTEPTEPEPKQLTLTQEELDAMIAKRLGQERKKYADYDDLKTKLSEYEAQEEERKKAQMSEQERIQAELEAAKKKAEEAEQLREQALSTANQRAIKAEFKLAAAGANIRPDALDDAFVLVDKTGISVDDDGNVVGVAEAISKLIESKPYLIDTKEPKEPKQIGGANNPKDEEKKTLQAQLEDARKRKDFSKVIELSNKLSNFQ